jgi:UDP-N-acetyl-2-amino-2-deoxyglucuronate dehydrogenase
VSKNFGLIGAAGYVAPKHMRAIKETGNDLLVAMDPNDSVGILDSYFPKALFFTEIENLDRHIYRASKTDNKLDYISVCSPNYLHDSHIRLGLRNDCDVICEKPLVINPDNIKYLSDLEAETNRRVNTVLQLRYHDKIIALKEFYKDKTSKSSIDLSYITSRGNWYLQSWKAQQDKSGGLAANIGIHFFDMLVWIFGDPRESLVTQMDDRTIAGELTLERANIKWTLSTDENMLPENVVKAGVRAYRSLVIDGKKIDFSTGFADLHTVTYNNILNGNGFGLQDAMASLVLCRDIMLGPGHITY